VRRKGAEGVVTEGGVVEDRMVRLKVGAGCGEERGGERR